MLRTSREQVKRRGNKDERGEKHALGSSGEVGLRAGRGRAGAGVPYSIEEGKRGRETRTEGNANGKAGGGLKESWARNPRSRAAPQPQVFKRREFLRKRGGGGDGTHHS